MQNFSFIYLFKKVSHYAAISTLLLLIINSCDESVPGCMDSTACNFNSSATTDDASCTYPQPNFDCSGECLLELDCADVCGGSTVIDCNGVCDGGAEYDCSYDPDDETTWENSCGGTLTLDCLDICGGASATDCAGECGGNAVEDCAGECGDPNGENFAIINEKTNCCGDEEPGCTGFCDGSYDDCNSNCCEPLVNNECLLILDDGDVQTKITFCENNVAYNEMCDDSDDYGADGLPDTEDEGEGDGVLEVSCVEVCKSLNVTTLDGFCEFHFGCATLDCAGTCAGGNTGVENYEVCDCFDSNAYNYWCNDGGTCPSYGSYESINSLDCQDECITGISGSYNPCNPATQSNCGLDSEISAFNDVNLCCYGCNDIAAANYDGDTNCTNEINDCQYENYLKIGNITNSTIEILINSTENIYGFQFNINGLTITGIAPGGIAESAGFSTSNGADSVLGFSLTGDFIPSTTQEEIFVVLNYESLSNDALCIPTSDDASLVLSGEAGADLSSQFIIHYENTCQ